MNSLLLASLLQPGFFLFFVGLLVFIGLIWFATVKNKNNKGNS